MPTTSFLLLLLLLTNIAAVVLFVRELRRGDALEKERDRLSGDIENLRTSFDRLKIAVSSASNLSEVERNRFVEKVNVLIHEIKEKNESIKSLQEANRSLCNKNRSLEQDIGETWRDAREYVNERLSAEGHNSW